MIFGENSRQGSSSLIVVMVVAVVALTGMLVYVAIDRNVLTSDGYALPGTVFDYSMNGVYVGSLTVEGYDDGTYYYSEEEGYDVVINEYAEAVIHDELLQLDEHEVTVDVPGIGNVVGTTYSMTVGSDYISITLVLHGVLYSMSLSESGETASLQLIGGEISLGDYSQPSEWRRGFSLTPGTTATNYLTRISNSTDGNYLYQFETATETYTYIGNESGIPIGMTGNSCTLTGSHSSSQTLTVSNGQVVSIGPYSSVS